MPQKRCWYAIYTLPRWEKKIASILEEAGITHYCPLHKVEKLWSDRKKIVLEPVFRGYVFVYVNEEQKWKIRDIHGILNYVYWLGKPAEIQAAEIKTIKKFLFEFDEVEVSRQVITKEDTVEVTQGILMNHKGMVLEIRGNKVRVRIDSMGITLSASFEKRNLKLVKPRSL